MTFETMEAEKEASWESDMNFIDGMMVMETVLQRKPNSMLSILRMMGKPVSLRRLPTACLLR